MRHALPASERLPSTQRALVRPGGDVRAPNPARSWLLPDPPKAHSCDQKQHSENIHRANWFAEGQPGDDGRPDERGGVDRIEYAHRSAPLECSYEKDHHEYVANDSAKQRWIRQ